VAAGKDFGQVFQGQLSVEGRVSRVPKVRGVFAKRTHPETAMERVFVMAGKTA
jgi:hypothetical protein